MSRLEDISAWNRLIQHRTIMNHPENHLKELLKDDSRIRDFSISDLEMFFDFSRQRMDDKTKSLLFELSDVLKLKDKYLEMTSGGMVNGTEKRAALHTAARNFSGSPVMVNNADIMPDIIRVRNEIKAFCDQIHKGTITGTTGKRFEHIVVIGIGGSYLGPEFVSTALHAYADKGMAIHYLSNVDSHNFCEIEKKINPETTLWVVISKSYTTAETTANTVLAYDYMKDKHMDPQKHVITVTSKGSPGDDPKNPVLASFHMFDFIGGRYSVTSAVGGVPLSLFLGYDRFEEFLKGAEKMDMHVLNAPVGKNMPLTAALISIWNNNILGYAQQAIIPYASPLSKLAPHIQQLYMESNGKSVKADGKKAETETGVVIFGEPGTNAQHSFFQLIHQGRVIPVDFIGVVKPQYEGITSISKGVTNHQELWANLISQPAALALGKEHNDPARSFSGNRPSSTLILPDLAPETVGKLLSFYEARTVFEAFVWDINPFDQFGVELGKKLADDIRKEMSRKNSTPDYAFSDVDPVAKRYLNILYS